VPERGQEGLSVITEESPRIAEKTLKKGTFLLFFF
jgi:hypothetical protein